MQEGAGVELDDVKAKAAKLSPWAHMATVGADGQPDVSPVHPCWEDTTLWLLAWVNSVKVKNIAANPHVALHWQVDATFEGLEVWGTAVLHDDLETKRRLWTAVFDYDLDAYAPGGPDASPEVGFIAVTAQRAVWLGGAAGTERWSA
jgi:general stress protein 26